MEKFIEHDIVGYYSIVSAPFAIANAPSYVLLPPINPFASVTEKSKQTTLNNNNNDNILIIIHVL